MSTTCPLSLPSNSSLLSGRAAIEERPPFSSRNLTLVVQNTVEDESLWKEERDRERERKREGCKKKRFERGREGGKEIEREGERRLFCI